MVRSAEPVLESAAQEARIAQEVRLVEARFAQEVDSLQKQLEAANKRLAEAVAHTTEAKHDASSEHERAVEARVADEVRRIETKVAGEMDALRNALAGASARADDAAKRLAHTEKRPAPSRSNGVVLLSGAIALLAVALLLFVFRPHHEERPDRSAHYEQLEKQLSDAQDAENGYQLRITALQEQVTTAHNRLKTDDRRVATLRSELADAQSRPAAASDPSQAAAIRSLRNELAAEQGQLKAARTAFVNVQHSRDEALAKLARMKDADSTTWSGGH